MTPLTARAKFVMTRNLFFRACPLWKDTVKGLTTNRQWSSLVSLVTQLPRRTFYTLPKYIFFEPPSLIH